MVYVRGNRRNFDQWAAEGAEGWSYKDVLPYFKKMEDNRDSNYVANGMIAPVSFFQVKNMRSVLNWHNVF